MLLVDFSPALAATTNVQVPNEHKSALLNFTAALSAADYTELKHARARLQLWSNIPFDDGRWVESDFGEPEDARTGGSSAAIEVYLGVAREAVVANTQSHVLSLQLSILLPKKYSRFSYTYRVAYPDGEIKWLGQFGQDGTLTVDHSQGDSTVVLAKGWSARDTGLTWTPPGLQTNDTITEVIRLPNPALYTIWTPGRRWGSAKTSSSVAFLVPRTGPRSVFLRPTYILSASPDTAITSISPSDGIISSSGAGSLFLRTYSPSRSDLRAFTNAVSPPDRVRLAALDTDTGLALVATPEGAYPVNAVAVPLVPKHTYTRFKTPLSSLAALIPDASQLCIYSPAASSAAFIPTGTPAEEDVSFIVAPTGGELVLSPVFNFEQCQVSILSNYTAVLPSFKDPGNLPTPPLSPQLRPVTISPSPAPTTVPTPHDVGIAQVLAEKENESEVDAPPDDASGAAAPPEDASSATVSPENAPDDNAPPAATSLALIRPGNQVMMYLQHVLSSARSILVTAVIFLFIHLSRHDREVVIDDTRTGAPLPESEVEEQSEEEEGESGELHAVVAPKNDVPGNGGVTSEPPVSKPAPEAQVPVEAPSVVDIGFEPVQPSGILSSLVVEVSEKTLVIAYRSVADRGVVVEAGGVKLEGKVKRLDDGVSLLEFEGYTGAPVKISQA